MKRVVFYYLSEQLAGAENQIIRICNGFINLGWEAYICDTFPSIIADHCPKAQLIEPGAYLDYCDLAIYFMSDLLHVEESLNVGKILDRIIWNVHPDNAYWLLPKAKKLERALSFSASLFQFSLKIIYPNKYRTIIRLLRRYQKNIYFMDNYNFKSTKKLFPWLPQPRYLPIVSDALPFERHTKFRHNTCSILFVGRLVEFKVQPLVTFINKLASCKVYNNYLIDIVGTGPSIKLLQGLPDFKNITIRFHGNLYGEELDELIKTNSVAFAMGTSSLDIACRGVPVILSPFGTEHTFGYCWLYNTYKYDTLHGGDNPQYSLEKMLAVLKTHSDQLSTLHRNYVIRCHGFDKFKNVIFSNI